MKYTISIILLIISISARSQSPGDLLNLLIENKTITKQQADSLRDDTCIKQQGLDGSRKLFPANAARQLLITGFGQLRYQNLDEKGRMDGFDIHRARLDIKATISRFWGYRFMADLAGSPKLMDVYAECKISDYFNLTLGQTKIPFSLESTYPDVRLEFIDRSQVVEALISRSKDVIGNQGGRDIGVQVNGSILKFGNRFLFDYTFGIFNGGGINAGDNNEFKDLIGRFVFHPLKGLDVGGSLYSGTGFYGMPTAENHTRKRAGVELSYENSGLNLKAEFIQGIDEGTLRNGWYAQSGYFILPQKLQLLIKFDTYDPDISGSNDISTIYLLGVNYNFNDYTRIQASYGLRTEKGISENNNIGSIQLQIGF